MRRFKLLAGSVTGGTLRTELFENRPYLVVPVIALVEGVVRASNSQGPELVLFDEFLRTTPLWNGRPVMVDHPKDASGVQISANDPKVLEAGRFGWVFNAGGEDKRLKLEAWLDEERAAAVEGAPEIIARIRTAVGPVEVSVGVFVGEDPTGGTFNGETYIDIWRNILPDHLAMLPEGTIGACSVEMGCGANRVASDAAQKEEDVKPKPKDATAEAPKGRTWLETVQAFLAAKPKDLAAEDMSDQDLRRQLDGLLCSSEPGYLYVECVYPATLLFIYCVSPDRLSTRYIQRSYIVGSDGSVALGADKTEVRQTMSYEPVSTGVIAAPEPSVPAAEPAAPPAALAAAADCSCKPPKAATKQGEPKMKPKTKPAGPKALATRSERIAEVVANFESMAPGLLSPDAGTMMAEWPDAAIEAADAFATSIGGAEPAATDTAPAAATEEPPAAAAAVPDDAKTLAALPEGIRNEVLAARGAASKRKDGLVAQLKDAQKIYSETELKALSLEQLTKVAQLVKVEVLPVDFSPLAPKAAATADDDLPPVPTSDDLTAKLKAARGIAN